MRKINIVIILFISILVAACKTNPVKKTDNLIAVSILPQKYFIDRISGNDFKVTILIPPGASPATYEPSPKQMREVTKATAYLRIGKIPFEQIWLPNLLNNTQNITVVDLSEGVTFIREQQQHGDHKHQGGIEPHIWSSPVLAKTIAQNTYTILVKLKPENQQRYQQNLKKLLVDINQLIAECNTLKQQKQKTFLIYHPALSYLAKDCGLQQIAIEKEGKEPSPAHLHELVKLAKQNQIKTIFIQQQFNNENAKTLANEIGAEIVVINPLSENWLTEMRRIISKLKK